MRKESKRAGHIFGQTFVPGPGTDQGVPVKHLCLELKIMWNQRILARMFRNPRPGVGKMIPFTIPEFQIPYDTILGVPSMNRSIVSYLLGSRSIIYNVLYTFLEL